MRKYNDISGKYFDDIEVIKPFSKNNKGQILWECYCKCKATIYATSSDLKRGRRTYCINCREKHSKKSPLKTLYNNYMRGARLRNLEFELTIECFESIIRKNCDYCGVEPKQILKKKDAKFGIIYNGIDRKNNKVGYTIENSVSSCKFCNLVKNKFSQKEFLEWITRVKNV